MEDLKPGNKKTFKNEGKPVIEFYYLTKHNSDED